MKRIITFIDLSLAIAVHAAGATNYGFYLGGVPVTRWWSYSRWQFVCRRVEQLLHG